GARADGRDRLSAARGGAARPRDAGRALRAAGLRLAMTPFRLRPMAEADLAVVNAIYNHYVLHSTCTYQLEPETDAGRAAWFREHGEAHPLLIAEEGDRV